MHMNINEVVIAIPSFERADTLKNCTLRTLENLNTKFQIYIFVSNEQEKNKYDTILLKNSFTEIIVTNTSGLANKRNFISDYMKTYTDFKYIVQLDDDILDIVERLDEKNCIQMNNFDNFCCEMFLLCQKNQTILWGVYPLTNPYFMNEHIWVGYIYCVGAFFGIIINKDFDIKLTNTLQEDKERTLKVIMEYGKVIRCNYVGIKTNYWTNKGGMQSCNQLSHEIRTTENINQSCENLLKDFAQFCSLKSKKKKHDFDDVLIHKKIFHKIHKSFFL